VLGKTIGSVISVYTVADVESVEMRDAGQAESKRKREENLWKSKKKASIA
jgi:hypothetical protein